MRRSTVLLLGAVATAGGLTLLDTEGGPPPAARLRGATLQQPSDAALAPDLEATPTWGTQFVEPAARTPGVPAVGPAPTVDGIAVDAIERVGDHYIARLPGGRIAQLTLEPALQELAQKLLDQARVPRGAIVAMAPDGRILALAGRRTADDKGGKDGIPDARLATDVWAPSASVFKLVTAAALVKAGVDPDAAVCYHGGVRSVMESNLADSKQDGRCESLAYGVAHSQNAILGKLAYQRLQPTTLESEARSLGWASEIDLGVPGLGGRAGELALPQTKDLEFAKAAAGFHGARLSVVGGAVLAATFANAGSQPTPRLIAAIDGTPVRAAKAHQAITPESARAVARMMVGTCTSGSAAKSFRGRELKVAGKTGTLTTLKPFYLEHSWFVGFAPAEAPEVIISVLLGNPEDWYLRGHEAARRMVEKALALKTTASSRDGDRGAGKLASANQ